MFSRKQYSWENYIYFLPPGILSNNRKRWGIDWEFCALLGKKTTQRNLLNICVQKIMPMKVVGNHHRIFKKLLNLATYGNLHSFSNIFWLFNQHSYKIYKAADFSMAVSNNNFHPTTTKYKKVSLQRRKLRYGEAKKVTYGYSHA